MRTSTSPAFGPCRSTSTISSGLPASKATAARVFMRNSPVLCFVQRRSVMFQMILDERRDEKVVVVVARAHAQVERLTGALASLAQQIGPQPADQRIGLALVDQDRARKTLLRDEFAGVVLLPRLAILTEIARERGRTGTEARWRADRRE